MQENIRLLNLKSKEHLLSNNCLNMLKHYIQPPAQKFNYHYLNLGLPDCNRSILSLARVTKSLHYHLFQVLQGFAGEAKTQVLLAVQFPQELDVAQMKHGILFHQPHFQHVEIFRSMDSISRPSYWENLMTVY